ncbi:MAG: hypothetical protein JWO21_654 [Solirubrobacterales bacterium]|jgi:hypothetical protein|nr:hypothetical protein [Solirubrobacterales bacterium]
MQRRAMAGKPHNGSAEIAIRTPARLAGALAGVLSALAFAGTASATVPAAVELAGTAAQSAQRATSAVAPVSEAAAGATDAARSSVPSAGVASAVEAVPSTDARLAEASRPAAGPATEAAGVVLPPIAKAGVQTVEHPLASASGGIADVGAGGESARKAVPLVTVTSKGAGALLAVAANGSQRVESAVTGAASALQSAARPVAAAAVGSSSSFPTPTAGLTVLRELGIPTSDGALVRGRAAHSGIGGAGSLQRPATAVAPGPPRSAPASAGSDAGRATSLSTLAYGTLTGLQERAEGLGAPRVLVPSRLLGPAPWSSGAAGTSVGATHQVSAARVSGRSRAPLGTAPVPMPGGVPASAAGGFGAAVALLLALAGLLLLAVPRALRRLRLSAAPWLGAAFVLIPERPG